MNNKTIYSVVDLEATGTDASAGDRIIQFSCTFVQDQKILDSFSTLINPLQPVPERITRLTGITNSMVKGAPAFTDVASLLYNMLQDTVFVAHNVNFDFPFLNHEFKRMGHPTLKIRAIDTVTMSQILLPMLPSYQLRRISGYFNIVHKHPHSASSDAYATADLLILLIDRLKRIPYDTLRGIIRIQPALPQNTMEIFKDALKRAKRNYRPLPSYLWVRRGLVLRKYPNYRRFRRNRHRYQYPASKVQKKRLFAGQLAWHPVQARMMDRIYRNYTSDRPATNWVFEMTTGMGRKIAYTLPLAYLSHNHHQTVIISTASQLLRKQLRNQTVPTLNTLLPFHISSLVIKDNANYIDLNRFFNTLRVHEKSNQTQLVKAMVLVWLTMTTTGDLNELHINPRIPYLKEIRHYQNYDERQHNPFYHQDFIQQHRLAAHRVNFVIMSQKYLYSHAREFSHLSSKPYLVIDEASQLPRAALSHYRFDIDLNEINIVIRKIMGDLHRTHQRNLHNILPNRFKVRRSLKRIQSALSTLSQVYQQFTHRFSITFLQPHLLAPAGKQLLARVPVKKLQRFFNEENSNFQVLNHDVNVVRRATNYFQSLQGYKKYRRINRLEMDNYYHHVVTLIRVKDRLNSLINQVQAHPENCVFEAATNEPHNVACCHLRGGLINVGEHLKKDLYRYYRPIIFTDHALIARTSKNISPRLKLPVTDTRQKSVLTYGRRHRSAINVYQTQDPQARPEEYCQALANLLINEVSQHPQRILAGFASRTLMAKTFADLIDMDQVEIPIYALGINGSQKRILKRLTNARTAIVLTNLNWFDELNLTYPKRFGPLIIADMPLQVNDSLYQQARIDHIKRARQSITRLIKLPNVILIMKRILSYLPDHHDRVIIFDGRLLDQKYLRPLSKVLPPNVAINPRKVKIGSQSGPEI